MQKLKHHIFVCTSSRINGQQKGMCLQKEGVDITEKFTMEIRDRDIEDAMVTNTGCFGICSKGPIVVVYPEGVWYGNVTPDDVEEIIEKHIEGGEIVKRLEI